MATKKSLTSSNSKPTNGTKPSMFMPIATAEMANAAETARIRAEEARRKAEEEARKVEEALKKAEADKKAADVVINNIKAIGQVKYGQYSKIIIARSSYDALNKERKVLVNNHDVLVAAEKKYKEFEEARRKAEEEARKVEEALKKAEADKKAADVVINNIKAIGQVKYGQYSKIIIARSSYDALNKERKVLVNNHDVLVAAEKKYKEFEEAQKKAEDQQKADLVIAQIAAIGVVEYLDACYKKINAARWAYAQLSATQKKLVENIEVLTSAGKKYEALKLEAECEARRVAAEEKAREKAEQEAHDKEIESILLAYCKKNGSSLAESHRDHVEYDMPRNRYDEIYDYVLNKNKQLGAYKYCLPLGDYDYYFIATDNKSFGISVCRKINEEGLWNQHEKKTKIGHIDKIFNMGIVILWAFFLIINAIYTWMANSWFSCIIWVIITIAVFLGIMSLMQKIDEEHPIETKSPNAGSIAHLVWRIFWVLGLSIICEIIMMVIFVF